MVVIGYGKVGVLIGNAKIDCHFDRAVMVDCMFDLFFTLEE